MARKKSPTFTDGELRIMDVLWRRGSATVAELQEELARLGLAYTTVLTTVQVLEGKGHVSHAVRGRAYVYTPTIPRRQSRNKAIRHFLSHWFGNSPNELLLNVIEEHDLKPEELTELMRVLRRKAKQ
jgi:predicted transcriptional regulator